MLTLSSTLSSHLRRASELAVAHVVPDASICMQCGTCSYSCPMGINVRAYAWRGQPIDESYCLSCGQCIARCPRQALRFAPIDLPKATGG
jgi:ferredoxin